MTLAVTVWHISALLGSPQETGCTHSLLRTDSETFPVFHESSSPSPFGKLLSIQTHGKECWKQSAVQREDVLSSDVSTATALRPLNNPWAPEAREVPQGCAVRLRKRLQLSLQDDSSLPPGSTGGSATRPCSCGLRSDGGEGPWGACWGCQARWCA